MPYFVKRRLSMFLPHVVIGYSGSVSSYSVLLSEWLHPDIRIASNVISSVLFLSILAVLHHVAYIKRLRVHCGAFNTHLRHLAVPVVRRYLLFTPHISVFVEQVETFGRRQIEAGGFGAVGHRYKQFVGFLRLSCT